MTSDHDTHYYRVICSSGDVFYTRARTATQFVLDPVFIQFMVLSIFLFTALMLAVGLPAIPQMILFGAGVVSTFFWLTVIITIYIWFIGLIGSNTIITPLLLIPMQVANGIFMNYILKLFETGYIQGFGFWEITIRSAIILICLDIMHGKYVAPMHGLAVTTDRDGKITPRTKARPADPWPPGAPSSPAIAMTADTADSNAPPEKKADVYRMADDPSVRAKAANRPIYEGSREIVIGREKVDLFGIRFIKSEDHYLLLEYPDRNDMIRGRLAEVVSKADVSWGIQINRSVWISYAALSEIRETAKGQVDAVMQDGKRLRVSKSRRLLLELGCNQFAPSIAWWNEAD